MLTAYQNVLFDFYPVKISVLSEYDRDSAPSGTGKNNCSDYDLINNNGGNETDCLILFDYEEGEKQCWRN